MKPIKDLVLRNGALLLALAVSTANGAVTLETLYPFGHSTNSDGTSPVGLTQGADGNLYGMTIAGGPNGNGTIFKATTNGVLTTLAVFNGTNGDQAVGRLAQGTNGTFYGATLYGGSGYAGVSGSGYGTVFQITTNGVLTSLVSFTNDGFQGYCPYAGLVQGTDGLLYGTTRFGGTNNGYGTVFVMTTGGALSPLFSFNNTNGSYPSAGLVQGLDGHLYGTTYQGGTNGGYGTIFGITTNGVFTSLRSLVSAEGYQPNSLVQASDGNLYGTTYQGGTNGYGAIFKITTNGVFTRFYSFSSSGGYQPNSLMQARDGIMYGTTMYGGTNNSGAIFKITTNGVLTSLFSFNYSDGYGPNCLVQGSDGDLYGTTGSGGTYGGGTIFKITTNGVLTTLYSFNINYSTDGSQPNKPVQGVGGLFYGTTENGGAYSYGTIYAISTNGLRTGLYSFTGAGDGYQPFRLLQARDGLYYGTTYQGGTNNNGTIFKVSTNGTLTTLHLFDGYNDGSEPISLVQGFDGHFYGTALYGGTNGNGTIFKVSTNGTFTTLHTFNYSDGGTPACLMQRNDGNFYGTTAFGGTNGYGTIFTLTPSGALTSLHAFNYDDGSLPICLVQGSDGCLYGTTAEGGTNGSGTIFKVTTNGTLATLHAFNNDDGYAPISLVQGSDGSFYGCTDSGGTNVNGTLFKIKPNGTFTSLYQFNYEVGAEPNGLVQGKDYNFYGTTLYGGTNGQGTFFRLNVPAAPSIITQPADLMCLAGTTATFTVEAEGVLPLKYRWQKNSISLSNGGNISGATSSTLTLSNVSLADSGTCSVVITNKFGSVTSSNVILIVLPHLPEALDATNLVWVTGGAADWFGEPWATHDGVDAGESGILMDSQEAWMETTVTGPGTLAFWWNVSSEADYDLLVFSVNDELRAAISGETGWQQETFQLGAGSQTLSWTYAKDLSVTLGADCGWVDQVSFVPAGAGPVFQRVFQTNTTFNLEWSTLPERMYQLQYRTNLTQTDWIDLGTPATNGTLSVPIGPDRQKFFRVLLLP